MTDYTHMHKISVDTQEMTHSRSTAPATRRRRDNNKQLKKRNTTYETTDAQTKKNFNRGTGLEQSV